MNRTFLSVPLLTLAPTAFAAPLEVSNEFDPGDPISSAAFNQNFDEIEDAVNDHDDRILALEEEILELPVTPTGAVMFFNLSVCPTGWTEMTGLRGRVPVAVPAGGTVGATVGDELDDEGLRTITDVPLHSHTLDPAAVTSSADGSHAHLVDPGSTATTTDGSHTHLVDPPSTSTTTDGSHTHTVNNGNGGVDPGYLQASNAAGDAAVADSSDAIFAGGSHNHDVDVASFSSGLGGSHGHTVDIASFTSSSAGSHAHTVDLPSFSSGPAGSGSVDVTMPYLQLLACQKN